VGKKLINLLTLNEKPCSDLVGDVILGRGRCQLCDVRPCSTIVAKDARVLAVDMFQHPEFSTIASALWAVRTFWYVFLAWRGQSPINAPS
jgi:hypothetical protein